MQKISQLIAKIIETHTIENLPNGYSRAWMTEEEESAAYAYLDWNDNKRGTYKDGRNRFIGLHVILTPREIGTQITWKHEFPK